MQNKAMTIGIDARFYGPTTGKGLGRYTKEVVDRAIKSDAINRYVVLLSPDNYDEFAIPNERVTKVLVKTRWYTIAEQFVLPWLIFKHKITLFHSPHFNAPVFAPCTLIVTIHDLILINFSTQRATTLSIFKYKLKYLGYKFVIWLAIQRAKKIIAVSEFTKADIIRNFGTYPDKITVTLEGIADFKRTESLHDSRLAEKLGLEGSFYLYIGNAYPHKNLEGLISAYADLAAKTAAPQLVFVGKEDYFYNRLKERAEALGLWNRNGINNKIIFAGFMTDEEISILFGRALVYIFPSFYEGFGLPPLEAMAHGVPVLSSNQSSMPEILGSAAKYFDPYDKDAIVSAMESAILGRIDRNEMIRSGYEQVKKYDWNRCAQETLDIYMKAI